MHAPLAVDQGVVHLQQQPLEVAPPTESAGFGWRRLHGYDRQTPGLCWCLARSRGTEQLADLRQQGRLPDAGGAQNDHDGVGRRFHDGFQQPVLGFHQQRMSNREILESIGYGPMAVVPKGQEGGHQKRSNVCASVVTGSGKSTELILPAGSLAWPSVGSTCGACCLTAWLSRARRRCTSRDSCKFTD